GHAGAVYTVAFSPDGRRLVSAGADHAVKVWDLATGQEILALTGHTAQFTVAAFSPDGKRVASASGKGCAVLLWDLAGLVGAGRLRTANLSPRDLEALGADLADADARKAYRAVWTLVATPEQAVSFLRERLRPAAAVAADPRIPRLIADLDDDHF